MKLGALIIVLSLFALVTLTLWQCTHRPDTRSPEQLIQDTRETSQNGL